MFQPEVKLEFVKRYCNPGDGWRVRVDIDASEEGRTGGERQEGSAKLSQQKMIQDAARVREELCSLGVQIGGDCRAWLVKHGVPQVVGDRDVLAFHSGMRQCIIAEVEGASSGQPEQKLYKAIGQIVMSLVNEPTEDWSYRHIIAVYGREIAAHLRNVSCLAKLGISGLSISEDSSKDQWLFEADARRRTQQ